MKPEEVISEVLKIVATKAKAGVSLFELDKLAEDSITVMGAAPYNKGYHPEWASTPYPATLCIGVNDTIAHGIPDNTILKDGDILSIDCGIKIDGKCGDAAITIPIGEVDNQKDRLLRYAKRALYEGISIIKDGVEVNEIGEVIERFAGQNGYVVNKNLRGHGIGEEMHQHPVIKMNSTYPYEESFKLRTGMIICIEPFLTIKDAYGYILPDGWTFKTRDQRPSAIFESMIRVESYGHTILTTHLDFSDCITSHL